MHTPTNSAHVQTKKPGSADATGYLCDIVHHKLPSHHIGVYVDGAIHIHGYNIQITVTIHVSHVKRIHSICLGDIVNRPRHPVAQILKPSKRTVQIRDDVQVTVVIEIIPL